MQEGGKNTNARLNRRLRRVPITSEASEESQLLFTRKLIAQSSWSEGPIAADAEIDRPIGQIERPVLTMCHASSQKKPWYKSSSKFVQTSLEIRKYSVKNEFKIYLFANFKKYKRAQYLLWKFAYFLFSPSEGEMRSIDLYRRQILLVKTLVIAGALIKMLFMISTFKTCNTRT